MKFLKRQKVAKIIVFAALLLGIFFLLESKLHENRPTVIQNDQTTTNPLTNPLQSFNRSQYSIGDPASIWVIVNKGRILPSSYVPANLAAPKVSMRFQASSAEMKLRQDAASALEQLISGAADKNLKLLLVSGYRSYTTQNSVFNGFVKSDGLAQAEAASARPGHSEHQTGLAADLGATSRKCELLICFGDMAEGKWLADNAYKYGFIIRYLKGKEKLTGYQYEPWHLRYVGVGLAEQVHNSAQTLEEYFNLESFATYPGTKYQLKP